MPPRIIRMPLAWLPTAASACLVGLSKPSSLACLQFRRSYATPQKKWSSNKKQSPSRSHYNVNDLSQVEQFSLVDAMRYIRAMEVGCDPVATKYELHVRLRTQRNGPTIKSRIRLPIPVKTDMRICVIADGAEAEEARRAGASLVGTDEVFEKIRNGEMDFDRVICHDAQFVALSRAKLGPILGPKSLMPSQRMGTVVPKIRVAMKELTGKSDFRERHGVVRMAIGQLAFTEGELQKNITAFLGQLKKEFGALSHLADKSINEVVLSSSHGAGFSLSGEFRTLERAPSLALEDGLKGAPSAGLAAAAAV